MTTANKFLAAKLSTATRFVFTERPASGGERGTPPDTLLEIIQTLGIECVSSMPTIPEYKKALIWNAHAPYTHFRPTERGMEVINQIIETGAIVVYDGNTYELQPVGQEPHSVVPEWAANVRGNHRGW